MSEQPSLGSGMRHCDITMKKFRLVFLTSIIVSLCLLVYCREATSSYAIKAKEFKAQASIWEVHAVDLNNDGKIEIILSGFDNKVYLKDVTGKDKWNYDVKGFPATIATGDVTGSKEKEIVVASQDVNNTIYLLDHQGRLIRKRPANQWLSAACIADINSDRKNEILLGSSSGILYILDANLTFITKKRLIASEINALAVGDIRGDKNKELIVGTHRRGLLAFDHNLSRIWRVPFRIEGRRWAYLFHAIRSVLIEDINLDGKEEVVVGSRPGGMVSVYRGEDKKIIWRYFIEHQWSFSQISIGNYLGDKNKEIVALRHTMQGQERRALPQLIVLDHEGKVILESNHGSIFFSSDSADVDNDGYDEIILSSPRRGHYFYILDIEKGSGNELKDLVQARRDGIDELIQQIKNRKPSSEPSHSDSRISILFEMKQPRRFNIPLFDEYAQFLKKMESKNIEFIIAPCSIGDEKTLNENLKIHSFASRFLRTKFKINNQQDVKRFVRQFNDRKVPFMPLVGQQNWKLFSAERLEEFLKASPEYCRGFYVYETTLESPCWPAYLDYLVSVTQLCKKYNKKFVLAMYRDFWEKVITREDFCRKMLGPEFRDVVVPMFKSTGMRTPELNIGSILGLWKTDVVDEWGISIQEDGYLINGWYVVAPNDVILRGDIMGAALGAKWFRIEGSCEFLESIRTGGGQHIKYAPNTHRHRGLFHDLLRKNIIRLTQTKDQVILSPVAFQRLQSESLKGMLFDYRAKMQSVQPDYAFGHLYQMDHYCEGFFPINSLGYIALLPYFIKPEQSKSFKRVLKTDAKLSVENAKQEFNKYARELSFRAEDVCLLVNRFDDEYRVYLISAGLTNIREVETELEIQLPGAKFTALDVITNQKLDVVNKKIRLTIPAGTFRLISIKENNK